MATQLFVNDTFDDILLSEDMLFGATVSDNENISTRNLNSNEASIQDNNAQDNSYSPTPEEEELAYLLGEAIKQHRNGEDVEFGNVDLHNNNVVGPELPSHREVIVIEDDKVLMSTAVYGGDGNNSSPSKDGEIKSSPHSSPMPEYVGSVVAEQNNPFEGQNNIAEYQEVHVSTSDSNDFVEIGDNGVFDNGERTEALVDTGKQIGDDHTTQLVGKPLPASLNPQQPAVDSLLGYSWEILMGSSQIPHVLKTRNTFYFLQQMVKNGGEGLEFGMTAHNIVALPSFQNYLTKLLHNNNASPVAASATANKSIFGNNAPVPKVTAGNVTSRYNRTSSTSVKLGQNGPVSQPSAACLQHSMLKNAVGNLGSPQAIRQSYAQWRILNGRPISSIDMSTLDVFTQPDLQEYLYSMGILMTPNIPQQPVSVPAYGRRVVESDLITPKKPRTVTHVRSASKTSVTSNNQRLQESSPVIDLDVEDDSGITKAEANSIVDRYLTGYKQHPAAIKPKRDSLSAPLTDGGSSQSSNSPKPKTKRSTKSASQKKKSPSDEPKPMHPYGIIAREFFGESPSSKASSDTNQDVQPQTVNKPKAATARPRQSKTNGNTARVETQSFAPVARMTNIPPQAMPMSQMQMMQMQVREMQHTINVLQHRNETLNNLVHSQRGAIEVLKETLGSRLNGGTGLAVPNYTQVSAYPGSVGTTGNAVGRAPSLKRSASVFESSTVGKRRCGGSRVVGATGKRSALRNMINPSFHAPVSEQAAGNTQDVLPTVESHDNGDSEPSSEGSGETSGSAYAP